MTRSTSRSPRKSFAPPTPTPTSTPSVPAQTLGQLLKTHGATIYGRDETNARTIISLLSLPAAFLDMPLQQITLDHLLTLRRPLASIGAWSASEGLLVLLLGMSRAYWLGLIAHAPTWLLSLVVRLEPPRHCRFAVHFFSIVDRREMMLRRIRAAQNARLSAAGKPLLPTHCDTAYVDEFKPILLLLYHSTIPARTWCTLEWSDIELARGVVCIRSSGGRQCLQLNDSARDILQKWYLQCPTDRLVFPPRAGQTPEQHAQMILRAARSIRSCILGAR